MKSLHAANDVDKPVVVRCDGITRQMLEAACRVNARSMTSEAKLRIKHHLMLYPDFHNTRTTNDFNHRLYIRVDAETYILLLKSKNRSGRTRGNEISVRLIDHLFRYPSAFNFTND
ncbi:TPA: TraY domain-containing protein [Enterobacter asburiae]